jgi:hypothetical protein
MSVMTTIDTDTRVVLVRGTTYAAALDPAANPAATEFGWPAPEGRQCGRGWQFVYVLTPGQAAQMRAFLVAHRASLSGAKAGTQARKDFSAISQDLVSNTVNLR